ncbi:MAG: bifunctional nuclease family protein [Candidatus Omnitrophica bacterium]|nr:bifunctional nuclease family protein [Candidatus Omnitrophota bacterium]
MIEMELNKIIIDEKRQEQAIVLKEKNGERLLPIIIGLNEASSIKIKLAGVNTPRPMTHDLLKNIIEQLGAKVVKVAIDALLSNTFHGKIFINTEDDKQKIIDARPSDSIALAVRTKSPIFVEEDVLKKAQVFKGI